MEDGKIEEWKQRTRCGQTKAEQTVVKAKGGSQAPAQSQEGMGRTAASKCNNRKKWAFSCADWALFTKFAQESNNKFLGSMKKIILSLLLVMFSTVMAFAKSVVYVPDSNGNFVLSKIDPSQRSILSVCEELGYKEDYFYSWFTKDYETDICFKIFSTDVICIITSAYSAPTLSKSTYEKILSDNGFDYDSRYDIYNRESRLKEAKEDKEKALSLAFMEEVTHQKIKDGYLRDEKNGYCYQFENGYLTEYLSLDGLYGYAKQYKGSPTYNIVKANAERYNPNPQDVIHEINIQFFYFARIEGDCLPLAKSSKYNYNYALLYVDLYKPAISLGDFMQYVHNKAETVKVTPEGTTLRYNYNYYYFNKDKILYKIE